MKKISILLMMVVVIVSGCGTKSNFDSTSINDSTDLYKDDNVEDVASESVDIAIESVSEAEHAALTESDFFYNSINTEKYNIDFGYYYGFAKSDLVTFKLSRSYDKDRINGEFIFPRNLTLDSTLDDYISAYDINDTNSSIQVWKGMSYFYSFDKNSISELTKDAEWADILIAWFQTSDGEWHRMSSQQVMDLMRNKLEGECKAIYAVNIDCKNPSWRNSVIITYSTLEDWEKFNM